jgi:hypothetical protein
MKFTVKGNTITIKYINNGKVKTMKLNIKDKIDLDFFNKLQQADTNNQDSMCDMYQRNILKPRNPNAEHITPLVLTKEIERPKIVKQQELEQRKRELEQDKQNIEKEAESLLKPDVKLDNLKENEDLTDKVNNADDIPKVKDIIRKYISIDKALKIVIQQADNVDIQNATNVNINEIKNATVKTYQQLEEFITKADISKESQKELIDGLAKMIGIVDVKDDTVIKIKYILPILQDLSMDTALKLKNEIISLHENPDDAISANVIKEVVGDVEFKKMIPLIKNVLLLTELQTKDTVDNFINLFDIRGKIKENILENYDDIIDQLFEYFNETKISYEEACELLNKVSDGESCKTFLQKFSKFSDSKATLSGVGLCRCYKDYVLIFGANADDFGENIFGKSLWGLSKSSDYSILKNIYIGKKSYWCNICKKEYLNNLDDPEDFIITLQSMMSLTKTDYLAFELNNVKLYYKYFPNTIITNTNTKNTTKLTYTSDVINNGGLNAFFNVVNKLKKYKPDTKDLIIHDEPIPITEDMTSKMEEADGLYSGKLDLETATLDEKLNEIIQILSRMNYNVFTTTPMYKESRNKYNKEPNTKKTNKNPYTDSKSKGIKTDLFTELNL